jgi:hypothetical protein
MVRQLNIALIFTDMRNFNRDDDIFKLNSALGVKLAPVLELHFNVPMLFGTQRSV